MKNVQNNDLKNTRIKKKLTQKETAKRLGVSLRSYVSYENDLKKKNSLKYRFLVSELTGIEPIDEEHGILKTDFIVEKCNQVFKKFNVKYCYLFGSYAKGAATEISDVDLMVSTDITGLKFFELCEELREALKKKIDLLDLRQILRNEDLANEVLGEGIRIYG